MYAYLSKRIAIPGQRILNCINWNKTDGWIACGADTGILKVLKLEQSSEYVLNADDVSQAQYGTIASQNNLSSNQTLQSHESSVVIVAWNEAEKRLTSSDEDGAINVWRLDSHGQWIEDMNSNRGRSFVTALEWTHDGKRICIVYDDGLVIVGNVAGSRVWRKDTKLKLTHAEWSPDDKLLLLGDWMGDVYVHDSKSSALLNKIRNYCVSNESASSENSGQICTIDWYDGGQGYTDIDAPTLALCYRNGKCQLMRDEHDDDPVLIDTEMTITCAEWSPNGSVLAIGGRYSIAEREDTQTAHQNQVQFYSSMGEHLRTLRVPGNILTDISWESTGLRLALTVDSFVFFANIRPDFKWGCFSGKSLVYAYCSYERPDHCIMFWNYKTGEQFSKFVKRLLHLKASGEHCCLVTETDSQSQDTTKSYLLVLCNSIGSPVGSKYLPFPPSIVEMTKDYIVACSSSYCYIWKYSHSQVASRMESLGATLNSDKREYFFHVDDRTIRNIRGVQDLNMEALAMNSGDSITAAALKDDLLLIGRESGTMQFYSLQDLALLNRHVLQLRPHRLNFNCSGTRFSVVDFNGLLSVYSIKKMDASGDTDASHSLAVTKIDVNRKDVWSVLWSDDDEYLFVTMEKTRMYTFRDTRPEEPVQSSAYPCRFRNLKIRAALVDELMMKPENPDRELMIKFETKSLRDTQQILAEVSIDDAYQFIKDNPHKRLWKLLAEHALNNLDFQVAHRAFVHCSDYQGLQFVKFVQGIDDRFKQMAEVCCYFKRFDEAERMYASIDRRDLAIEMRMRIGDWFGVLGLIGADGVSSGGNDEVIQRAWDQVGDFFFERQQWAKAVKHYESARNYEKLVRCHFMLDDFESLETMIDILPEGSPLLVTVAEMFASVGLARPAVRAFLRCGEVQMAIDSCVELNEWDIATALAEEHNVKETQELLAKYASHLVDREQRLPEAVELYRRAGQSAEAAKVLTKLAHIAGKKHREPIKAKMLFVFAALEVEKHKRSIIDGELTAETRETDRTLKSLLKSDGSMLLDGGLDNVWRGAEAYHFYMLAQRQLHTKRFSHAAITAARLAEYDDILDAREVYSIAALASFYAGEYGMCSSAVRKLEVMDSVDPAMKAKYADLAVEIFSRYPPNDSNEHAVAGLCPVCQTDVRGWESSCSGCGERFHACVTTGKAIILESFSQCRVCRHQFVELDGSGTLCPLCHSDL